MKSSSRDTTWTKSLELFEGTLLYIQKRDHVACHKVGDIFVFCRR
ncbi:hypothetical protein HMPREF0378_1747 [Eubacterium nodatum ATCC 33099]|nr:hypothetical protein HMPREF0378_1747 [Eubacterium nodatum ATCC 33099]